MPISKNTHSLFDEPVVDNGRLDVTGRAVDLAAIDSSGCRRNQRSVWYTTSGRPSTV